MKLALSENNIVIADIASNVMIETISVKACIPMSHCWVTGKTGDWKYGS
jgi:hypothetical protein